jgi:stage V sporulation protein G
MNNADGISESVDAQATLQKINVKIGSIRREGSTRAIASAVLDDCVVVRNIKVMESSKGLFVSMPSFRAGNGEYKEICYPITAACRQQINDAVINAYHQALAQGQKTAQQPIPDTPDQNSGIKMGGM